MGRCGAVSNITRFWPDMYICIYIYVDNIRKKDGFEVVTVVTANIFVIWGVTTCNGDGRVWMF